MQRARQKAQALAVAEPEPPAPVVEQPPAIEESEPFTAADIDRFLDRCTAVVEEWATAQAAQCTGVPQVAHRAMLMNRYRHVVDAAREVLKGREDERPPA
jgi:hypothetical protein